MTNQKIAVARGTSDILPDAIHLWQTIEHQARQIFKKYNYKEIRTPAFEESALFKRSLGQTSDVVNKQLLELSSQKEDSQSPSLALRPEGTASIVRSYIENSVDRKEGLTKLFYIGPMFRGERPQKGRLRQFHQIGVEVIGPQSSHPYLDADVISLSLDLLKSFGLQRSDIKLKINTLGTPQDKEQFSVYLRQSLQKDKSQLCEDCQNRFDRNIFRILDCKNKQCQSIVNKLTFDYSHLSAESLKYYQQLKKALSDLKVDFEESPKLVRGLDYYTHTVFEISAANLGSQDAVGAGGRYNNLVEQLGGNQVDAVGFALGIERILIATEKNQQPAEEHLQSFIIALDEKSLDQSIHILQALRQAGIPSDLNYKITSMKSQMRLADKNKARFVIIIGENELSKEVVAVKDMKEGQQKEISIKGNQFKELIQYLTQI